MNELNTTQQGKNPIWFKCILAAGMLLFSFYASTHMVAAGDTWVAMACGRHFDNHGVDTVEPFSFNSHKAGPSDEQLEKFPEWTHGLIRKWHPTGWIDQNWLTQLIFYKWAKWAGSDGKYNYNTLVYWKFILYGLTVFSIFAIARVIGVGNLLAAAGACLAMVVGRTFFDIRPAGYSNLLVPVFILVLALAVYRNYRLIWLMVPVIVFWANVHGGYIYAFIMLVPFIGIHTLLRLRQRWSISLGFIGLWLVLYLMSYKFLNNNLYMQVQELAGKSTPSLINKMLFVWMFLSAGSIAFAFIKNIKSVPFYAYHLGMNVIYFLSLIPRFFPSAPARPLASPFKEVYFDFISSSQLSFIFVFIVGAGLVLGMALKKEKFIALPVKGIYHVIAAAIVSFLAMVVFNPFHLTNLTHTFEISVSKHAESWRQVNEWKPAFDWMDKTTDRPNPVGKEEWFGVLCILTGIATLVWIAGLFLKPREQAGKKAKAAGPPLSDTIQWPKIDLALIIISLLTIYMAIRSRRFIAIAGSAAAPAVMLMITQAWQMITCRIRWNKTQDAGPIPISPQIVTSLYMASGAVIVVFGLFWGYKFKCVYLDPWPTHNRYNNIFMRMTASHVKPYEICDFINLNHISGRVFNYWTEGGAIAFGQTPDPETGKTPLQLFMDGRAQAAYNHEQFIAWKEIDYGGPVIQQAMMMNKKITPKLRKESGQWINSQLKADDVWVILMPQSQGNSGLMLGIQQTNNWKTAYLDNTQHLMVDIETPQGKKLIEDILSGKAAFPDEFSRNLSTAAVIIENKIIDRYSELYSITKKAFDIYPAPSATVALARLDGLKAYSNMIADDLQQYLDDFIANKKSYAKEDGIYLRLSSANIAAKHLAKIHPDQRKKYLDLAKEFETEIDSINEKNIW